MRKQRLRGEMTFPISHTRMQPLKAETLALKEATQVLRDPRGNCWPQTGEWYHGGWNCSQVMSRRPEQALEHEMKGEQTRMTAMGSAILKGNILTILSANCAGTVLDAGHEQFPKTI